MYWYWYYNSTEARLMFSRNPMPTARKEHQCCECDTIIKVDDRYSYFVGLWEDDNFSYRRNGRLVVRKTCLKCDNDWETLLSVFRENDLDEMGRVYGSLRQAIWDAFNNGLLTADDQLVKDWLYLEIDPESLSPSQLKEYQERKALAEMRACSCPFL